MTDDFRQEYHPNMWKLFLIWSEKIEVHKLEINKQEINKKLVDKNPISISSLWTK